MEPLPKERNHDIRRRWLRAGWGSLNGAAPEATTWGPGAAPAAHAIDHDSQASRPLSIIAMALLVAFTDPGDRRERRQVVRDLRPQASG